MLFLVRSTPNCAEPAVSTMLPLYGGDISCTTRGFVSTDMKTEQNSINVFMRSFYLTCSKLTILTLEQGMKYVQS